MSEREKSATKEAISILEKVRINQYSLTERYYDITTSDATCSFGLYVYVVSVVGGHRKLLDMAYDAL